MSHRLTCTNAARADRCSRARERPSFPVVPRLIWHGWGTVSAVVCQCPGVASTCARSASEMSRSLVQLHPWLCPGAARCKPGTQPTARLRRWPRVPCQRRRRSNGTAACCGAPSQQRSWQLQHDEANKDCSALPRARGAATQLGSALLCSHSGGGSVAVGHHRSNEAGN